MTFEGTITAVLQHLANEVSLYYHIIVSYTHDSNLLNHPQVLLSYSKHLVQMHYMTRRHVIHLPSVCQILA